jgi:hypothetical protein
LNDNPLMIPITQHSITNTTHAERSTTFLNDFIDQQLR